MAGQKETTTRNDVTLTAIIFLRLAHVNSEFESRVSVRPSFPLSHTLALRFKTQEIHTASRRKMNIGVAVRHMESFSFVPKKTHVRQQPMFFSFRPEVNSLIRPQRLRNIRANQGVNLLRLASDVSFHVSRQLLERCKRPKENPSAREKHWPDHGISVNQPDL